MQITWIFTVFLGYYLHVFADEFSCLGRVPGYYADIASDCERYHVCTGGKLQYTYSCPNTTRFLQQMMICDHAHRVDCSLSETYFSANLLLGQRGITFLPQSNTESYDRVKKTKNSEFFTTQKKVNYFNYKTTRPSPLTSSTLRYNRTEGPFSTTSSFVSTFSTTKPLTTTEHSTTFQTSTQRIKPVLENDEIKPLPGPPISLNELFEKLKRGRYDSVNEEKSNEEELTDKSRRMKLDWILPDVRAMFYIPDNEKDSVVPNIKRYSVVIPESKMIFKSKELKNKNKICPSHCDPLFLNIETCSPCVMIK